MVALGGALLLVPIVISMALSYLMLFHLGDIKNPYVHSLILSSQREEAAKNRTYLQESINAMAVKLGQMQAQMMRLDAFSERLAKLGGMPRQEFQFGQMPGRGGAESSVPSHDLGFIDFGREINRLGRHLDDRADQLAVMESMLLRERVKQNALPSALPVATGWFSSNFGWRLDPFTGKNAFHEGVDFMAEAGSDIMAAAGGIVIYSDYHDSYGNMVEIDHGNGLVSRYAHASRRLVKVGDIVLRGQKIAEVGSTGRSTGPHLHFEVLYKGAPQNPTRYLHASG